MTATESYLEGLGVSMNEARVFVMDNVPTPEVVFNICKLFSINNDMIAEVLQPNFQGLTGEAVSAFFNAYELDGPSLGFHTSSVTSQGTLNIADILTYEEVNLYENISESYAQQLITTNSGLYDAYLLTETENIGSPADYGYTNDGGEYGGVHTYEADNGNELIVLNGTNLGNPGNYDLVTADLIA